MFFYYFDSFASSCFTAEYALDKEFSLICIAWEIQGSSFFLKMTLD